MNPDEWIGIADDVAISEYLKKENCECYYLNRNDLTDFYPFRIDSQHRIKSWDNSEVTLSRFNEIHQMYTNRGIKLLQSYFLHNIKELKRFMAAYPPYKGLNSLRAARFLAKQALATVFNFSIMIDERTIQ
jgi:hypothetical protein